MVGGAISSWRLHAYQALGWMRKENLFILFILCLSPSRLIASCVFFMFSFYFIKFPLNESIHLPNGTLHLIYAASMFFLLQYPHFCCKHILHFKFVLCSSYSSSSRFPISITFTWSSSISSASMLQKIDDDIISLGCCPLQRPYGCDGPDCCRGVEAGTAVSEAQTLPPCKWLVLHLHESSQRDSSDYSRFTLVKLCCW